MLDLTLTGKDSSTQLESGAFKYFSHLFLGCLEEAYPEVRIVKVEKDPPIRAYRRRDCWKDVEQNTTPVERDGKSFSVRSRMSEIFGTC